MGIITTIENELSSFFAVDEKFVLDTIVAVKNGVAVAENDVHRALKWVDDNAAAITSTIQTVTGVVASLKSVGVAMPPAVDVAVKDANTAVAALNAYADAVRAGKSDVEALKQGYVVVKQVTQAGASASIAVATSTLSK